MIKIIENKINALKKSYIEPNSEEIRKIKKNLFVTIGYLSIFIGAVLLWHGIEHYLVLSKADSLADRGLIGDSYGAANSFFSSLGFAGVVLAIILQSKELGLQRQELSSTREVFDTQRFENTFFHLISLYNQNVDNMRFDRFSGRVVFDSYIDEISREYINQVFKHKLEIFKNFPEYIKDMELFYGFEENHLSKIETNNEIAITSLKEAVNYVYNSNNYQLHHYYKHIRSIIWLIQGNSSKNSDDYIDFFHSQLSRGEELALYYFGISDKIPSGLPDQIQRYRLCRDLKEGDMIDKRHYNYYSDAG